MRGSDVLRAYDMCVMAEGVSMSQNGRTALIGASNSGLLEVVKALLAAGADKDAKSNVSA